MVRPPADSVTRRSSNAPSTRNAPPKTARRRAREIALQALYGWQLTRASLSEVLDQARALEGWDRADTALAETLMRGVIERCDELEAAVVPHLDRSLNALSPIERVILCISAFELLVQIDTPLKVIINEAIELAKSFGGTDGHRYINGVVEKLATVLRAREFEKAARARSAPAEGTA